MARLLIAVVVLGASAFLLVTVAIPRLRKHLGAEGQPAAKPAGEPAAGPPAVTGEVTDATREAMRKHFEEQKKARQTKPGP